MKPPLCCGSGTSAAWADSSISKSRTTWSASLAIARLIGRFLVAPDTKGTPWSAAVLATTSSGIATTMGCFKASPIFLTEIPCFVARLQLAMPSQMNNLKYHLNQKTV